MKPPNTTRMTSRPRSGPSARNAFVSFDSMKVTPAPQRD
jgi:hypothetical protein